MTTIERAESFLLHRDATGICAGCCTYDIISGLIADNKQLRQAIITCLDNNGHLADGEDCTLIDLKRAVPDWGVVPLGVYGAKTLAILDSV